MSWASASFLTIPDRFAHLVAAHPDRMAVQTDTHHLTYAALDALSNRFAHAIAAHADPSSLPVAVWMRPDAPLVAAILGILKTGRPYVYLDARYPPARSEALLTDTGATVLIRDEEKATAGLAYAGAVVDADRLPAAEAFRPTSLAPTDIAALFYTSGSTGHPKGVLRSHQTILHATQHWTTTLHLTCEDRLSLLSSLSFGASCFSTFGALLNGACLFPFDTQQLANLPTWLDEQGITGFHAVPTVFRYLAQQLPNGDNLPALRFVRLGGEAVYPDDVALFRSRFAPSCRLVNSFSMTEAGGCISYFVISHDTPLSGARIPIGQPCTGKEIVLVDEANNPVPDGEVGEITVRGHHLGAGYWNAPEQTARRFEPLADGQTRLRTGERGRVRPDGLLEHRGRNDHLVKVRGFRVELGDIEAVLVTHPEVQDVAVVVPHQAPDQLVAYVTSTSPHVSPRALRAHAQKRLPNYMVPVVIQQAELPRTANGKLDRKALAAQPAVRASTRHEPPQTDTERHLAALLEEILGIQPIGRNDHFYDDLGGHSVHVARLVVRLEQWRGKPFSMLTFFKAPTVALLAQSLDHTPTTTPPLVPLQTEGTNPPLFLIHPMGGHLHELYLLTSYLPPTRPIWGFEAIGLSRARPQQSIRRMARRYLKAMLSVQATGPWYLGGYSFGGLVAYEMALQLQRQGKDVELVLLLDTRLPRPLRTVVEPVVSRKPLARIRQLRRWAGRWYRRMTLRLYPSRDRFRAVKTTNRRIANRYHVRPSTLPVVLFHSGSLKSAHLVEDWRAAIGPHVQAILAAGDHETMLAEPHVKALATQIDDVLSNVQAAVLQDQERAATRS